MPFPNIVFGQIQQLEADKLKKEIELLNLQIKNASQNTSNVYNTPVFIQTITILGGISIAGATAFFAWQRERRIPPSMEQERIIQDTIKEWYSNNYLKAYHNIWKKIEESNNNEKLIDEIWQKLSNKKFPDEYFDERLHDLFAQIEYFRNKLHLGVGEKEEEQIEARINAIRNIADVEFYAAVRRVLPIIVDNAVMATINSMDKSTPIVSKDYESLVASSLKNLKSLMIFYRIRENKQVCEILIRAKLNEKIFNINPTLTDFTLSGDEI